MKFLWPELLGLLLAVPLLVWLYLLVLRRKKRQALRYASLGMLKQAAGASGVRRHLPPLLFLLALIVLIVAIARPTATITLPSAYETIILAMDVSGSMRAADVQPNRIGAAQAAARALLDNTELGPSEVVKKALTIAGDLCIYTNQSHTIEAID